MEEPPLSADWTALCDKVFPVRDGDLLFLLFAGADLSGDTPELDRDNTMLPTDKLNVPIRSPQCSVSGVSTLRLDLRSFSQIPGSIGVQVLGRSLEVCSTSELFWGRSHFFAENAEFRMCKLRVPESPFLE